MVVAILILGIVANLLYREQIATLSPLVFRITGTFVPVFGFLFSLQNCWRTQELKIGINVKIPYRDYEAFSTFGIGVIWGEIT